MARRITMADVAREAGVSLMTVSRALNDKDGISEVTRQRIQAVVDRLGYRPSSIARGLVTKRTGTIGLVVPDNSNPFFSEVARGVEHAAYAEGYNVFLCNTEEDPRREKLVLESLTEKLVDGLILCSSRLANEELHAALNYFATCVMVNRAPHSDNVSGLRPDDAHGSRQAIQHLLSRGHRAIAYLGGPERSFSGGIRKRSYFEVLEEVGIIPNPGWVRHCLPMVDASQQAAKDLLCDHPEVTAFFCFNDLVAVGALKACAELGLAVPDDVMIVGFDDIPLASFVSPALTTVNLPRYELGRKASETLMLQINGQPSGTDTILPVELVIRGSAP